MIRLQPMIVGVFNFMEIFKDIIGFEGNYQVSNFGRVKSLPKKIYMHKGGYYHTKERILKQGITKGYHTVGLCKNRKVETIKVHKLVAMAFLNHKPCGMKLVVDHINGKKSDNRVDNLQVISQRENTSKNKKDHSSQYTGVSWSKNAKKWRSQVSINGKISFLGYFHCELEAKRTYEKVVSGLRINKKK